MSPSNDLRQLFQALESNLSLQSRTGDRQSHLAWRRVWRTGADELQRRLLGIIDHGTRCSVHLMELRSKASLMVLYHLLRAFWTYGVPKKLRVDNEASFNARWFKHVLFTAFGTAIHTTPPHSPWKNGRIERFFRTFKEDIQHVPDRQLEPLLGQWRWHNNHARPHSGIGYLTPAEAWNGKPRASNRYQPTCLWGGALRAHFFPT